MPLLADALSGMLFLDKPVVDQTGLEGTFDFTVEYTNDGGLGQNNPEESPTTPPGSSLPNAVHEQLGLKLVPSKAPIRTLIIDRVERPSEN